MSENLPEPVQPQLITPAGTTKEVLQQFELYQSLKEKIATDDDFVAIGNKKHPKKSFVRKVQRFFNLSCELLNEEPVRDADGAIVGWKAVARATHLPTGAFQDGDGACEHMEKSSGQATLHNVRAHAVTRAKNRAILDLVGFGDVSAEEIVREKRKGRSSNVPVIPKGTFSGPAEQYNNKPITELPTDFLEEKWLPNEADDYWISAIEEELRRRA